MQVFSSNELLERSSEEILSLLKKQWGYQEGEPFDLIGKLKKIPTENGGFYILESIHSVQDGSALLYPLDKEGVRHTVYVGMPSNDFSFNDWVKARVKLSPKSEREKHDNPFALKVINDSLQQLEAVPESAVNTTFNVSGESYLEQWVLDVYRSKHLKKVEEEYTSLKVQLDQHREEGEQKIANLRNEADKVDNTINLKNDELKIAEESLSSMIGQKKHIEDDLEKRKKHMEYQLGTLANFIEEKTRILIDLDLIDESEVEKLKGSYEENTPEASHDFEEVLNSDINQAISYIQAHLYQKGIVYRRSVLEDFYALIKTHDLIILAGDSGSGKTNLVKSFAKAIGGKSVVIPVKPNWTSAEDLLGYYNPIEQKYLPTPFLEALLEAEKKPDVPYFICLDEMNLARVEYYFADFLSLMEERGATPKIPLYSQTEAQNLHSEARNFLALIDEAKLKMKKGDLVSFLDLLRDEQVNTKLHELCGFREGDSLLRYHARLRKLLSSYLTIPSSLKLPSNVRIIGAINVDETTHYLSPKILDRAHVMRFNNPLLSNWEKIDQEIESFDLDIIFPLKLNASSLGMREDYPKFDRADDLTDKMLTLVRDYLNPLGVEFGLRTVRQASHYRNALSELGFTDEMALNNIILHKVLPKLMFDGEKPLGEEVFLKDVLFRMKEFLENELASTIDRERIDYCIDDLDRVIKNAQSNDWVVNYWSR